MRWENISVFKWMIYHDVSFDRNRNNIPNSEENPRPIDSLTVPHLAQETVKAVIGSHPEIVFR